MIFQTANAIDKILRREKTQTRRLEKPDQLPLIEYWSDGSHPHIQEVFKRSTDRPIYRVGQTYAVQSGRNLRGAFWYQHPTMGPLIWSSNSPKNLRALATSLRIRILTIRREDVRNISNDDIRAEGYPHARDFLHVWCAMHDPILERGLWGEAQLMARPADRYQAWALTFEVT